MAWVALTIGAALAGGVGAERRLGARAGRGARALLRVMLFALQPFVTFFNLARLHVTAGVGAGVLFGWLALLAAGAIAWVIGRRVLGLARPSAGTLTNVAMQGNTSYLGLPLCAALLGSGALSEAVAYDALVQGPVFLTVVFAVAAATGTRAGESARERLRAFVARNPPLLAAVAGLLAPAALAPDTLVSASRVLVFALLPLGFFAVGVTLAEEAADGAVAVPPPLTRRVAVAVALRILVAPALLMALSLAVPGVPAAFLLLAAMPVGVNAITVAHVYGLDLPLAAGAIAWSTLLVVVAGIAAVVIL